MMKNWRSLLMTILFSLAPCFAEAVELEVAPLAVINAAAPSQRQNGTIHNWTGNTATGYGLLASVNLWDSPFYFETGMIYLNQSSERTTSGNLIEQKTHQLHIPFLIRFQFDEKIGIGFGGYTSIAKGSVLTSTDGAPTIESYSQSGILERDFGLILNARASINIIENFYCIIDGRYQHGLSNLSAIPPGLTGDYLNTRSMQAYLGISYHFSI